MLKDGTYAAWFNTPLGSGTGIAHVENGKIWGRDSIMFYVGTCEVDGDRFTAQLTTNRHADGPTLFGSNDELTLKLEGTCRGKIAHYTATTKQFPGVQLRGTLIYSEEQPAAPRTSEPLPKLDPAKLPKLPTRSR
ncbi:hypothetical protein IVB12_08520 [Bradyrhizobium sp. 179]|uniref:hypothetical protein n=1 Tax=Bradyrhizobium sp. 179 TaxID=2782648 RepID=UPI001FFAE4C6|nr:hypothetical protein [Bradyrhizobium sp. 179]MCK1542012.1 hypothetical protein [Bradyrhizobium sp. 179]